MKAGLKLAFTVVILAATMGRHVVSLCQSPEDRLKENLLAAFEAVAEAEKKGGDVSKLVIDLNEALRLLEVGGEADLARVEVKIEAVLTAVPEVEQQGILSTQNQRIMTGAIIGVISFSAVLVWRLGPRVFWSLWLRSKREWRVHS